MSQRCSTCSTKATGLAGLSTAPAFFNSESGTAPDGGERRRRLSLNKQMVGAGLRIAKITARFDDHQMHIERLRGRVAHRVHDGRAERDVRREPAVHNIDMNQSAPARSRRGLRQPPQSAASMEGATTIGLMTPWQLRSGMRQDNRSIALANPSLALESVTMSACLHSGWHCPSRC